MFWNYLFSQIWTDSSFKVLSRSKSESLNHCLKWSHPHLGPIDCFHELLVLRKDWPADRQERWERREIKEWTDGLTEGYVWMDGWMHAHEHMFIIDVDISRQLFDYLPIQDSWHAITSRYLICCMHCSASSNPQARRSSPAWSLAGKTKMSDSDMGPLAKDKVCEVREKKTETFC